MTNTWLQCGHGAEAVENVTGRGRFGRVWCCFNAATARRPWRTSSRGHPSKSIAGLQCGHGAEAVENCTRNGAPADYLRLQCGHGAEAVENEEPATMSAPAQAASMRPRRGGRGERRVIAPRWS